MPLTRSCLWQIPSSKPVSLVCSLEILNVRLPAVCRPCFFEGQRAGVYVEGVLDGPWRRRAFGRSLA